MGLSHRSSTLLSIFETMDKLSWAVLLTCKMQIRKPSSQSDGDQMRSYCKAPIILPNT